MTGSFEPQSSGNDRSYGGSDRNRDYDEDDTELIAAEIRITQERLGDTVEEIGERFNPTRLKEELKHDIRDATIGKVENMAQQTADLMSDAQRTLMQSIRDNPLPVAIAGIGIVWTIMNASSRRKQMRFSSTYDDQQPRGSSSMYDDSQYGGYDGQGGNEQGGALDRVREKASEVVDTLKQKTSEVAGQTRQTASRVGERAQEVAGRVVDQTRNQTMRVEEAFQDNPLVIGAAALALGLAAGLAFPVSQKETELVGDKAEQFVERAREVAEDTKSKVQQVAERVVEQAESTAKDAAHEVGLMS